MGQLPPTFAEISSKLLQNRGFLLKLLSFAPPLLVLPPNLQAGSNAPVSICLVQTMNILDFVVGCTAEAKHLDHVVFDSVQDLGLTWAWLQDAHPKGPCLRPFGEAMGLMAVRGRRHVANFSWADVVPSGGQEGARDKVQLCSYLKDCSIFSTFVSASSFETTPNW